MRSLIERLGDIQQPPAAMIRGMFLLYLIGECVTDARYVTAIRLLLLLASVMGLVVPRLQQWSIFWVGVTAMMIVNVVIHYASAANHHFVTVYAAAYFLLAAAFRERRLTLPFNVPRLLLIVVFFFATLQKLLSEYFMSGRLIAGYCLKGRVLQPLLSRIFEGYGNATTTYRAALDAVANDPLSSPAMIPIDSLGPGFVTMCVAISWAIIAAEGGLFLALAVRRVFLHWSMPAIMLVFVWSTFLFREEVFFFALLCILFAASLRDARPLGRWALLTTAAFFVAFGMAGLRA